MGSILWLLADFSKRLGLQLDLASKALPALAFVLSFLILPSAQAEYRVFVLQISRTSTDPASSSTSPSFESTLDPEQYRGYYPLAANERITYTDTWRCYGRTDNRPHCPNPRRPPEAVTP